MERHCISLSPQFYFRFAAVKFMKSEYFTMKGHLGWYDFIFTGSMCIQIGCLRNRGFKFAVFCITPAFISEWSGFKFKKKRFPFFYFGFFCKYEILSYDKNKYINNSILIVLFPVMLLLIDEYIPLFVH